MAQHSSWRLRLLFTAILLAWLLPVAVRTGGVSTVRAAPNVVSASLSVTPSAVEPGAQVTVTGSGFAPYEEVHLRLTTNPSRTTPRTLGLAIADSSGSFSVFVTIPADQAGGQFVVAATGAASGRSATAPLTVTSATLTLSSTSVAAGETVTLAGAGFMPGETVDITMTTWPAHVGNNALGAATADSTGAFTITVTIPLSQTAGGYLVQAGGVTSGRSAGAVLRITALAALRLIVFPARVAAGAHVTIAGTGFLLGETIGMTLTANPMQPGGEQIATATAVGAGSFTTSALIPAGTQPGSYTVVAAGMTTGRSASATIQVTASAGAVTVTPTPAVRVTPTPGVTITPTPVPLSPTAPTSAYFAEGYTGTAAVNGQATFTETLNVLNPASSTVPVTITYYIQGRATPMVVTRSISATSVLREVVNGDVGNDKQVAAVVTAPRQVFVSRTISRVSAHGARLDGSATLPVGAPAKSWGFPEGFTGVTFQEYLTILNPNGAPATVSVLLAPQAASSAGAKRFSVTVPPYSRSTENIRALNQGGSASSVGMLISSDQPIVAERVLYFGDGSGSGKFGSTVSRGISAGATRLYIAYGNSGGSAGGNPQGNQAFITLLNPASSGAVQVTASFYNATGHRIGTSQAVTVGAGTRQTIIANNVLGRAAVSPFSVVLSATGPVMAESAQYFYGSPNTGPHPGVDFEALAQGGVTLYLSDLATKLPDGTSVSRYAFLYNPGSASILVTATYFGGNGATTRKSYSVPPGGVTRVSVNQDAGSSIPAGPLGAEFVLASPSTGSFFIYTAGLTSDGRSATEEVGTPAS